mmetsp:Transcript_9847/g.31611  ORF Transcript_9847/g.31611 Transcript_9847/m.31611 type:complete len:216 (-) Transcript_9847:1453-2100(-)
MRSASSAESAAGVGASKTSMCGSVASSASDAESARTKPKTIIEVRPDCIRGESSATASGTPTAVSASAMAPRALALASSSDHVDAAAAASWRRLPGSGAASAGSSTASTARQTPFLTMGVRVSRQRSPHLRRLVLPVAVLGTSSFPRAKTVVGTSCGASLARAVLMRSSARRLHSRGVARSSGNLSGSKTRAAATDWPKSGSGAPKQTTESLRPS